MPVISIVRPMRWTMPAALLLLGACHSQGAEQHDPNVFSWSGSVPAAGSVHVRSLNGPIEVKPSRDSAVHVTVGARWRRGNPKRDLQFQVASAGNTVTVCVIWGKGACTDQSYTMKNPSLFKLGNSNSGTDATAIITVEVPARVRVDAFTANGDINITATAPVHVINVNGNVTVATAVGPVDALTVNGNVDVRMTTLGDTGTVRAETVSGSAVAYLPATIDGDFTLKVMNGRLTNDFGAALDANAKSQTGTLGKGGRTITVKALTGSASLRRLNADGTPMANP